MPVNKDGVSVAFQTTLLALIRTSLDIYVSGNMFSNDKELRRVMETIWPKDSQKNLSKLLPKMKGTHKHTHKHTSYFYTDIKFMKIMLLMLLIFNNILNL